MKKNVSRIPKDVEKKEFLKQLIDHQKHRFERRGLNVPAKKELQKMALNELRFQKGIIRKGIENVLSFLEQNPVDIIVFTGSSAVPIRDLLRMSAKNYSPNFVLPKIYSVGRSAGRVRDITDFKKAYEQYCNFCPPLKDISGKTVLVLDDVSGLKAKSLVKAKSTLQQGGANVLIGVIAYTPGEAAQKIDVKGPPLKRGLISYGIRRRVLTTDTGFFFKPETNVKVRKKPKPNLKPLQQTREIMRDIASRVKNV